MSVSLAPKPSNLPTKNAIISHCAAENKRQYACNVLSIKSGTCLLDDAGIPCAWVRFGPCVTMAEADAQIYVAAVTKGNNAGVRAPLVYDVFSDDNGWIYLVSELVVGRPCTTDSDDIKAVARAVAHLTTIPPLRAQPGPPRQEGPILHTFFNDSVSPVAYSSVAALQNHVNNILRLGDAAHYKVDLEGEVRKSGLRLCLSFLQNTNFIAEPNGTIVLVNFSHCSFLPPSFFDFALHDTTFASLVALALNREKKPANMDQIFLAHSLIICTQNNSLGLPASDKLSSSSKKAN